MRIHTGRKIVLAALATSALGTIAVPAFAQDAQSAAAEAEASNPNEIIVSARRRNESIQSTPIAVTAIQGAQLEGAAALTIGDLQGAAPNVLITSGGTGAAAANISIRGIAFADIEKSFDPAVGVNIDGVYIGTSTGQMLDFFDIDSIEVLRGPQGTLFGRNTIAGVINIKRSRPKNEFTGKMEAEFGSYGRFSSRNVVNLPVVDDVLAAKAFYMHTESNGFYRNFGPGASHRGGYNNENFGVSMLFTPTSNFDALITLEKQVQDFDPILGGLSRTGDAFAPFLPPAFVDNGRTDGVYDVMTPVDLLGTYRSKGATGEMNLDLGGVKLTSVTGYRESTDQLLQDYATSGLYVANRDQDYWQFSQELRASGKLGDTFDYVAGVYYFKSKYDLEQHTSVFGAVPNVQNTTGWSESYAGFLDVNWEVFDRVRLSGGGRYTHDKKALQTSFVDGVNSAVNFNAPRSSKSWSKFTPKVGIDYRPTQDLMVYASWSRGFRSGGFNGRGLTLFSASLPYDPETVDSYEVGIKSELFDRMLTVNLAGFYSDYKDIQQTSTVATPGSAATQTVVVNAAAAKI
ncbi:MAG: TonB-dependent receptor, partial [Novosphingobium sp.]